MATLTWNDTEEYTPKNNPVRIIIPIAVIVAIFVGVVLYFIGQQTISVAFTGDYIIDGYYDLTPAQIRIIEVVSGHAWQNHGNFDVTKGFECFGKYGSAKAFKTFGFKGSKGEFIPTSLWMCFDKETGDWYAMVTTIFEKVAGNKVAKLVIIYKISRDLFPTIDSYIDHIVSKWGAIILNYSIGAEKLFLQPFK